MKSKTSKPEASPIDYSAEPNQTWWRHYSPHGEFTWSSSASVVLHLFLLLIVIVGLTPFLRRDPTPPAVDGPAFDTEIW